VNIGPRPSNDVTKLYAKYYKIMHAVVVCMATVVVVAGTVVVVAAVVVVVPTVVVEVVLSVTI
jgi:hypothetical protein